MANGFVSTCIQRAYPSEPTPEFKRKGETSEILQPLRSMSCFSWSLKLKSCGVKGRCILSKHRIDERPQTELGLQQRSGERLTLLSALGFGLVQHLPEF